MNKYDLAIIGSGPCGYVASIRAAQLGMKVCLFEKEELGGVCLNSGCIPTKALQASSRVLENIRHSEEFGVMVKGYGFDFAKAMERKHKIVKKLVSGIEMLIKARNIDLIREKAELKDNRHLGTENSEYEAKFILVATGSLPYELPNIKFDGGDILSSSDMLSLQEIPKSIIIVGGGVIGCEFASIFRTFGSEISIVEMMDRLLPTEDKEISKKLEQVFRKSGIKVHTNTKIEKIGKTGDGLRAQLSNGEMLGGENALISVGRTPNSKGIGLEKAGIETDNKGWVKVDKSFRTNVENIYAAGDVKGGILLAHVASREGIVAVSAMAGKEEALNYNAVPNCIFTSPEIASVGLNEDAAKKLGHTVVTRKFLYSAIGKSHVLAETDGFIKLVVETKTDVILGAQIIGGHATELIAELVLCVQFGIKSEDMAKVIHAHPTLSEVVQEVTESVHNRAIHSI